MTVIRGTWTTPVLEKIDMALNTKAGRPSVDDAPPAAPARAGDIS